METEGQPDLPPPPPLSDPGKGDAFREQSFNQRLEKLRDSARHNASKLTGALSSLALLLQILGAAVVGLVLIFAANVLFGGEAIERVGLGILAGLGVMVAGYGTYLAGFALKAFEATNQEALRALSAGLGELLVVEELPQLIKQGSGLTGIMLIGNRSTRVSWEEHLRWFACHFASISSHYSEHKTLGVLLTKMEAISYKSLSQLNQPTALYCLGGCLTIAFAPIGIPLLILTSWLGLWHLSAYSRLVAITEYLLGRVGGDLPKVG